MSIARAEKKNVLFVDDEEAIVNSLKLLFRRQKKFNVFITTDQHEALNIVDTHNIHVVVSDMRMPGMNGAELLLHVKEKSPNTIRILLTGYSEMENIIKSINTGEVYRFLEKPWSNRNLKEKVSEAVDISASLWENEKSLANEEIQVDSTPINEVEGSLLFIGDEQSTILGQIKSYFKNVTVYDANTLQKAVTLIAKNDDILTVVVQTTTYYHNIVLLLKVLKGEFPLLVSIVIANDSDSKLAIGLVNEAQVFRYLTEPIKAENVYKNVYQALKYSATLRSSPILATQHNVEKISDEEKSKIMSIIDGSFLVNIGKRFSSFVSSFGR